MLISLCSIPHGAGELACEFIIESSILISNVYLISVF